MALQSVITGKAYVLGDNVDTDQIIPAQYLTFNPSIPEEYKQFGKYALSSVPPSQSGLPKGHVPFHTDDEFVSPYKIIIGGKNFGCGSSREHAPIALDAAGIEAVVAEFYARIFYRNSVNGGYLIPFESVERLCDRVCTGDELRWTWPPACCATSPPARNTASSRWARWRRSWRPAASSPTPARWECSNSGERESGYPSRARYSSSRRFSSRHSMKSLWTDGCSCRRNESSRLLVRIKNTTSPKS